MRKIKAFILPYKGKDFDGLITVNLLPEELGEAASEDWRDDLKTFAEMKGFDITINDLNDVESMMNFLIENYCQGIFAVREDVFLPCGAILVDNISSPGERTPYMLMWEEKTITKQEFDTQVFKFFMDAYDVKVEDVSISHQSQSSTQSSQKIKKPSNIFSKKAKKKPSNFSQ